MTWFSQLCVLDLRLNWLFMAVHQEMFYLKYPTLIYPNLASYCFMYVWDANTYPYLFIMSSRTLCFLCRYLMKTFWKMLSGTCKFFIELLATAFPASKPAEGGPHIRCSFLTHACFLFSFPNKSTSESNFILKNFTAFWILFKFFEF